MHACFRFLFSTTPNADSLSISLTAGILVSWFLSFPLRQPTWHIFCHLYQDYFKIFNAVRDCGLFPEQLATDCALPWIYPEGCHVRALRRAAVHNNAHACDSNPCIVVRFLIHYDTVNLRCAAHRRSSHPWGRILLYAHMCRCVHSTTKNVAAKGFNAHHDSRHRWGETVTGVSLGRNRTLSFIPSHKSTKSQCPPGDLERDGNAALGISKGTVGSAYKDSLYGETGNRNTKKWTVDVVVGD